MPICCKKSVHLPTSSAVCLDTVCSFLACSTFAAASLLLTQMRISRFFRPLTVILDYPTSHPLRFHKLPAHFNDLAWRIHMKLETRASFESNLRTKCNTFKLTVARVLTVRHLISFSSVVPLLRSTFDTFHILQICCSQVRNNDPHR